MIKPTNGRIVLYTPTLVDIQGGMSQRNGVTPLAAMVVDVWGDRAINITVFDSIGERHARTYVQLLQDDDERPIGGGFATWMDHQKGQAAKTEALEAAEKIRQIQQIV